MSMTRTRLTNFRQFSMVTESPRPRKPSKKQFSEDVPDFKDPWFEQTVKLAWTVDEGKNPPEEVIIKKCPREFKKGRLTRHSSLEKDSILNSKQEQENLPEPKPNLDIYLAHNPEPSPRTVRQPKYLQPLLNNPTDFKIKTRKPLESPKAVEAKKTSTIVVVPLKTSPREEPIQVVITPTTAQTKRENFQKRTNSAFNGTNNQTTTFRPPLVRSSSAPSIKVKGKFLATKRKLKSGKKVPVQKIEQTEWCATNTEIETMVSLVSPSGSEAESDDDEFAGETRPKSALKGCGEGGGKKGTSLRKTVKTVTFQQSSIHAVRSFSASFPARRASMVTALAHHPSTKMSGKDKRATNSTSVETQERVPKRKLLRSNTGSEPFKLYSCRGPGEVNKPTKTENDSKDSTNFEAEIKLDFQEKVTVILPLECKQPQPETVKDEQLCETVKEKQCWDMYQKMSERGINVSYDTILRGLLTPTEYRIRRTTSIADEMNLLLNPPVEDSDKPAEATIKAETF